jgi:murein DD-endopeptidase MepM/ murein hydrolase activator NlpD
VTRGPGQRAVERASQALAAATARRAAHHTARSIAGSTIGKLATRAAARGIAAVLFKAGGVFGAKAIAIVALILVALALVIALLSLLVGVISAPFQQTTAVWPVSADIEPDGTYQAGGWAISSRFGWRNSPFTHQPEFHDGIDIVSPLGGCPFGKGCELPSMFDGRVEYVGWDQTGGDDPTTEGGGQIVTVENGAEDHRTLYAHLEPYRLHVQLQGRIEDDYGRFDDEREYQPIGVGELTPGLDDGDIEMWCALEMPEFRPTRTGPGTVTFVYDRPARCRTSVVWGRRTDDWEGWNADDPPADADGRASLAWETPIESGKRSGDVALRFRAHLVPPPPPPTATPTAGTPEPENAMAMFSDSVPARAQRSGGRGGVSQGLNMSRNGAARAQTPQACERLAGGMRCAWRIADIPLAEAPTAPMDAAITARTESGVGRGSTRFAPAVLAADATPVPTTAPLLSVVTTASQYRVPTGGRFRLVVSVFNGAVDGEPITLTVTGGAVVRLLDANASNGSCSVGGQSVSCTPVARPGAPATITVVIELLPNVPRYGRVELRALATDDARTAEDMVVIEEAGYAVTPGPWPPATVTPAPSATPEPTLAPVWPTIDPDTAPLPTATATPLPPGQGPGTLPVVCAPQALVQLPGVVNAHGGTSGMQLSNATAAAFQVARVELQARTGRDVLQRLADGLRQPEFRSSKPGVARMSWHMTGRAIDLDTSLPWRRVREGRYWRLWLSDVDVTTVFARHGFSRIPDRDDSVEWWHYEYRPDGLAWTSAMLQVWPASRLERAFPEIAWASVGCQGGGSDLLPPLVEGFVRCIAGEPSFASAVEELPGCGPPVRAGDQVYQLDSILGFVGMTGRTTGPHLHLGLQVKSYDGIYHQVDICTPDWLQGVLPPPDVYCWTEMADPLAFLPLAPPPPDSTEKSLVASADATAVIPEGAPWQLPPPNYPGSLLQEPASDATPEGQYWSPYQDGGQYGGGGVLEWFQGTTCNAWGGFPWCQSR